MHSMECMTGAPVLSFEVHFPFECGSILTSSAARILKVPPFCDILLLS